MSGTDPLDQLEAQLWWRDDPELLSHVFAAVKGPRELEITRTTAVCFDSNIFINLGKGARAADLIDYFVSQHQGPVVVSTQTLTELWNNHLRSSAAVAQTLKDRFEQLNAAVEEIDDRYSALRDGASGLITEFEAEFGHVFAEGVQADLLAALDMLAKRGVSGHVPRDRFLEIARMRKRLKIPPGFLDDGDGDFYVWADALFGLLKARAGGATFDGFVLVTEDKKKDWSLNGKPHPALVAEVMQLFGVPFAAIKLSDLRLQVNRLMALARDGATGIGGVRDLDSELEPELDPELESDSSLSGGGVDGSTDSL